VISEQIALYHPKPLLGIHITEIPYHHVIASPPDKLNEEEKDIWTQLQNGK